MDEKILHESYKEILDDGKLITLATITTIFHSLIFVLYFMYIIYQMFLSMIAHKSIDIAKIIDYLKFIFSDFELITAFLFIIIILAVGYFLLPPIAEGAIIYYINDEKKEGTKSIIKGVYKFFPMFEYYGLVSVFSFFVFLIAVSRLYIMGILSNIFVIIILSIWLLIIFLVNLLLPYVRFFIIIENMDLKEAISNSIKLAMENIMPTLKLVLLYIVLYIRFFINIVIVLGVPLLIIYLAIKFNIGQKQYIKYIVGGVFAIMIFFMAYVNGIIDAFFITYWLKAFKKLRSQETN